MRSSDIKIDCESLEALLRERRELSDNLRATQERCTQLIQENRDLKATAKKLVEPVDPPEVVTFPETPTGLPPIVDYVDPFDASIVCDGVNRDTTIEPIELGVEEPKAITQTSGSFGLPERAKTSPHAQPKFVPLPAVRPRRDIVIDGGSGARARFNKIRVD